MKRKNKYIGCIARSMRFLFRLIERWLRHQREEIEKRRFYEALFTIQITFALIRPELDS